MKKLLIGAFVALLPLTGFSATILGFQAGAGAWTHDPSGSINSSIGGVGTNADLKNGLNLSEESEGYAYFLLEHPVPLIPNVKFVSTTLTSAGSGTVKTNFTFNNQTFDGTSGVITTKLELNQTDLIAYYEILDNVVSFDVGLNAKILDGKASVGSEVANFTGTIPMLYVAAEIALPADITLAAEISTLSVGSDSITDTTAKVMYTTDFGLGIEAGIRSVTIDVDLDSVKANVDFSGVFAGAYFKF